LDLIHAALKKAQDEGRIEPGLFSLIVSKSDQRSKDKDVSEKHYLPQLDFNISSEMTADIRIIVENIHSTILQNKAQVIGFTSALPEEGTSTLAAVASSLMANKITSNSPGLTVHPNKEYRTGSSNGQGILLIDAQLRSPSIHKIFGYSNEFGLNDLLNEKVMLNSAVKHIADTHLKIIPFGKVNNEQNWTIDKDKLGDIFEKARHKFEFVCVDLPSLINYSEGVSFSKLCDGIILVIQAGQTSLDNIKEAKQRLQAAEVNILGSILNRQGTFIPDSLHNLL